jgi:3-oxoacyl-[acyl-carrier-protein] synthase-3
MPASAVSVAAAMHTLELKGRDVFKAAVRQMTDSITQAAEAMGISPKEFDLVIPHQANARIVEAVGSQLGTSAEQLVIDIGQTGNTAAASIPIAIGRARERGQIRPGQLIAVVGFGAGMAWACQVLRVNAR